MKKRTTKGMFIGRTLRGFSLGEVILSMTVLIAGILPVIAGIMNATNTSFDSQETIIASGLAQEGVEFIQNVRDNAILGGHVAFAAFPGSSQNDCRIGLTDGGSSVLTLPSATNQIDCSGVGANRYDLSISGNGFYVHRGADAKFERRIYLGLVGSGTDAYYDVVSAVYWDGYSQTASTGQIETNCHPSAGCVYSKVRLTQWR